MNTLKENNTYELVPLSGGRDTGGEKIELLGLNPTKIMRNNIRPNLSQRDIPKSPVLS